MAGASWTPPSRNLELRLWLSVLITFDHRNSRCTSRLMMLCEDRCKPWSCSWDFRCLWSGAWAVQPGNRGWLMSPQLPFALSPLKLWFIQILCPKQPPPLNYSIMWQILESVQTSHFYSCSIGGLGTKKISTHGVRFAHFNLKGRYTHYSNLASLCCTIIFFYCIMCLQICDGKQNCSGEETC